MYEDDNGALFATISCVNDPAGAGPQGIPTEILNIDEVYGDACGVSEADDFVLIRIGGVGMVDDNPFTYPWGDFIGDINDFINTLIGIILGGGGPPGGVPVAPPLDPPVVAPPGVPPVVAPGGKKKRDTRDILNYQKLPDSGTYETLNGENHKKHTPQP